MEHSVDFPLYVEGLGDIMLAKLEPRVT